MISKKQFYIALVLVAFVSVGSSLMLVKFIFQPKTLLGVKQQVSFQGKDSSVVVPEGLNFIYASETVSPAVVHIKTSAYKKSVSISSSDEEMGAEDLFRKFHNDKNAPKSSSGSGVIVSENGYIATNNHVIEGAEVIEIILHDKRTYQAQVVGNDLSTDLALLKIEEKNLPYVAYGDSDKVRIGEWVLAIGNPFDLTSTVTAGIVSAKARNINLIHSKDGFQVEAFLQTDAAVNRGNSGGALVNLKGELVGINTAIASQTGNYEGYSFAVPVNLVKKVMRDLLEYGEVQRALLGIEIAEISAEFAKEKGLESVEGVYIIGIAKDGGAYEAGLRESDVIVAVEAKAVNSMAQLQAIVASKRPGERVEIIYKRNTKEFKTSILLKNKEGKIQLTKKAERESRGVLGAEISNLTDKEKEQLSVKNGIKVLKIGTGKIKNTGIKVGFVVTHLSKQGERTAIKNVNELIQMLSLAEKQEEVVYLEGIYENGSKAYYPLGW